jgi:Ulp1 family protease
MPTDGTYTLVDPRVAGHGFNNVVLPDEGTILWPVFYCSHWILAVIRLDNRIFDVFDSLRDFAHPARIAALRGVQGALHARYRRWYKARLKACEQQEQGSNDCGLFAINNALAELGEKKAATRKGLMHRWRSLSAEDTMAYLDSLGKPAIETPPAPKTAAKKTPAPARKPGPRSRSQKKRPTKKKRVKRRRWTPKKRNR